MATQGDTQGPEFDQLSAFLARKIGRAAEKVIEAGDVYRGLSKQLESTSALRSDSDDTELRDAATSLRAIALHAVMTAAAIISISEAISVCAEIREMGV